MGRAGVVAIERPVPRGDRFLLVGHRRAHIDAVGDARAVGDDHRGAPVRLGLAESLERLQRVGAHGDGGHVDIAVVDGHHAQVFLAHGLAAGGVLGHGGPRGGLGSLAAGVRVDLGVQHQDIDVAARGQDVIQPTKADVVSPAVATHDPDATADQGVGHALEQPCLDGIKLGELLPERGDPGPLGLDLGVVDLARLEDRPHQVVTQHRGHPPQEFSGIGLLLIDGQPHPQAELGAVLEQRVIPGRALPLLVLSVGRRGQVAAVDR